MPNQLAPEYSVLKTAPEGITRPNFNVCERALHAGDLVGSCRCVFQLVLSSYLNSCVSRRRLMITLVFDQQKPA